MLLHLPCKQIRNVCLCLIGLSWLGSAFAQKEKYPEDSLLIYSTQVIEVRSEKQSKPYAVSSLDRQQIQDNPGLTMEPALQLATGIWMQSGAPNTHRISIRGVGNREPFATSKLKVYLDEIPLTTGVGESSIEDIDPYLLQGIDIWKSPASALWGAGLGGMMQLKSRRIEGKAIHLQTQIGAFGLRNNRLSAMTRYGKKQQHGTLLHLQDARQSGYRANNDYQKQSLSWLQDWQAGSNWYFKLFAHGIQLKAFIPSSLSITDFQKNPRQAAANWAGVMGNEDYQKGILGLHSRHRIDERWTYKSALFLNTFSSDEVRPFNVLQEDNHSLGTRQRLLFAPNSSSLLSFGVEFFRENYAAQTFEVLAQGELGDPLGEVDESRHYWNGFMHYEQQLSPALLLNAGFSFTQNRQLQPNTTVFRQQAWSPSVGLSWQLPDPRIVLFASVSNGFSPISFSDALDSDGQLNTDLQAETGWNTEIGAKFASRNQRFSAEATLYHMQIRNLLVQKRIAEDQFVGANAGKTRHAGVELQMQTVLSRKLQINAYYTYTHHRFEDYVDGEEDFSGNELTGSVPHTWLAQLVYQPFDRLKAQFRHRYLSRVPITDNNQVYGEAYQLLDAALFVEVVQKPAWSLQMRLGVNNLFDTHYAAMYQINARAFGGAEPRYYYPGPSRHMDVQLRFVYEWP